MRDRLCLRGSLTRLPRDHQRSVLHPTKEEGEGKEMPFVLKRNSQSANAPLRVSWRVFKKAPADPQGTASLDFVSLCWRKVFDSSKGPKLKETGVKLERKMNA